MRVLNFEQPLWPHSLPRDFSRWQSQRAHDEENTAPVPGEVPCDSSPFHLFHYACIYPHALSTVHSPLTPF